LKLPLGDAAPDSDPVWQELSSRNHLAVRYYRAQVELMRALGWRPNKKVTIGREGWQQFVGAFHVGGDMIQASCATVPSNRQTVYLKNAPRWVLRGIQVRRVRADPPSDYLVGPGGHRRQGLSLEASLAADEDGALLDPITDIHGEWLTYTRSMNWTFAFRLIIEARQLLEEDLAHVRKLDGIHEARGEIQ